METSAEDSEHIIRAANLTSVPPLPWNNNSKKTVHGTKRSKQGTAPYMSQLDPRQIEALVQLYQMDFEIFGYEPDVFFD